MVVGGDEKAVVLVGEQRCVQASRTFWNPHVTKEKRAASLFPNLLFNLLYVCVLVQLPEEKDSVDEKIPAHFMIFFAQL